MKIGLVAPWKPDEAWRGQKSFFGFPPLGLLQLAAVTPPEIELELVDEGVRPCPTEPGWDAAGLSVLTACAPRAYELADRLRARGIRVILGGSHVTACPEEAAEHADAIALGEGEAIWPEILEDLRSDRLKPRYRANGLLPPEKIPAPRRELYDPRDYRIRWTVQASRGCPHDCSFCSTTRYWGHRFRFRPVEDVIREVAALPSRLVVFVDDNLFAREDYAVEFLRGLRPLGKRWVTQATLSSLADRPALARLAARAGCLAILVGFETISPENLRDVGKGINDPARYREQVQVLHRCGVLVQGSFVIGLDGDTPESLARLPDFIHQVGIDTAGFCILTPLPGTELYDRLDREGRLLTRDWDRYNRHEVTFQPRHMSPRRLKEIQLELLWQIYSWRSIRRRATWRWPHGLLYWPYNIGYRRGVRQFEDSFTRDIQTGRL